MPPKECWLLNPPNPGRAEHDQYPSQPGKPPHCPRGWVSEEEGEVSQPWGLLHQDGRLGDSLFSLTIKPLCGRKLKLLSCVRLFANPMDCNLPGSSVHGVSQARILEWVAISSSRRPSQPIHGIKAVYLASPTLAGRFFTTAPSGKSF